MPISTYDANGFEMIADPTTRTALTVLGSIATLGSDIHHLHGETHQTAYHLHHVERVWGAVALPDEDNAIEANVNRPFSVDSGANTWGAAIPICGELDVPVLAALTLFDPHMVLVVNVQHATAYRLRFIYGTGTSADAIAAGQFSEIMFIAAAGGPAAGGEEILLTMPQLAVGTKLWAQVWNATDTSTVTFYWAAHGYT